MNPSLVRVASCSIPMKAWFDGPNQQSRIESFGGVDSVYYVGVSWRGDPLLGTPECCWDSFPLRFFLVWPPDLMYGSPDPPPRTAEE